MSGATMDVPSSDAIAAAFELQAEWCSRMDSPLYSSVLGHLRDDLLAGGVVSTVVEGFSLDPIESALPLRLMGGLHRLVLLDLAPDLARHYPSVGGEPDHHRLGRDVLGTVSDHVGYLADASAIAPQTNEIGRSAALLPALGVGLAEHPAPIRLLEIGSSGGLNLFLDRFAYDFGSWTWGPATAHPVVSAVWEGGVPALPPAFTVIDRRGCDLAPLDVTDPQQRLRLLSFVWADQRERFDRMSAAITLVSHDPPRLDRQDAAPWLADRLFETRDEGTATVVQHSVMWQYLEEDTRTAILEILEQRGSSADDRTPLIHISLEPSAEPGPDGGMAITMRRWPGTDATVLGWAHAHGAWIRWVA